MVGPRCPNSACQQPYELVMAELSERVFFAKTFMCPHCMEIWTLDIEEMENVIRIARNFWGMDDAKEKKSETPEDWARLRQRWDNGEEID